MQGVKGRDVLSTSQCLSADVNAAFDPTYADVYEKRNACFINKGVCITKYTGAGGKSGTSDASAEYMSGNGGDGAVSFHREKYVAAGGPDGGDGGKGGNIVFVVSTHLSTLSDFRYKRKYRAEDGGNGKPGRGSGKKGADLIVQVPLGTLVRDAESGRIIADLSDDQPHIIAKGGKGGWGNTHFATPTRQVPKFAKPGIPGEEMEVMLELKLLADVGLVGFPNVGKSSLINEVSEVREGHEEVPDRRQLLDCRYSYHVCDRRSVRKISLF